MFSYIKGILMEKKESSIILENNGIGFDISISNNTLCSLPGVNEEVQVFTFFQVREDGFSLFGFSTIEEKNMFLDLISVSGVGPKMALQILSGARLSDLGVAISSGDVSLLSKIKGCGKKTAERIIVELKDKIDAFGYITTSNESVVATNFDNEIVAEATELLMTWGLSKSDASRTIKAVYTDGDTIESVVQKSLTYRGGSL